MVTVSKPASLSIIVTIPDGILEWFVSVVDTWSGQEMVSDWCDHYATDGETEEDLYQEMREEIARILDAIVDVPVRLVAAHKPSWLPWRRPKITHALESQAGAGWEQVIPLWTG